jgi:hypothetical protein
MVEQDGEALLYTPYWRLEHKGEPRCIGSGVRDLLYPPFWSRRERPAVSSLLEQEGELYPPCWSRRERPAVSSLLEQEGETCCILPVGSGRGALLYLPCCRWRESPAYPPCWSRRESPDVSFLLE